MPVTRYGVEYDAIAPTYDAEPLRRKNADAALLEWLAARSTVVQPALLDIACGTGSQLVANRAALPAAVVVGLDASWGMLARARGKDAAIGWVRGDGARLPFAGQTFDYATCQFALHHVAEPARLIAEAFRVLRPGGRLVVTNVAPHAMPDWPIYRWFPAAREADARAFPTDDALVRAMRDAGFTGIRLDVRRHEREVDLRDLLRSYQHRSCSQLIALPDQAYRDGLQALARAVASGGEQRQPVRDVIALLTLAGDRPVG